MSYSVSTLQTLADCDELLSIANKEKAAMLFRQTALLYNKTRYADDSVQVEASLQAAIVQLAGLNTLIAPMPDGKDKEDYLQQKRDVETKIRLLKGKIATFGTLAQLNKEWGLARVALDLSEADAFIASITARKAQL